MKSDYYVTIEGSLTRDQNTLYFANQADKRIIPVEKINSIYSFKSLSLSAGVIGLLCKYGIPVHFFGWYGNYEGTLWPKETLVSGDLLVQQVNHYANNEKRIDLARKFVIGSIKNIQKTIMNYQKDLPEIDRYIASFERELALLESYNTVQQLMSSEGHVRDAYYEAIDSLFPDDFKIGTRERMPPSNKGNCLISFANGMLYSAILSEIYHTHLNPTISYLHEPSERRFSLSLDIADIFKPIISDRVILSLVNRKMLDDSHFDGELGNILMSDKGRKLFIQHFNDKMNTTIKHKGLNRNVSYRHLIRLELYKIEKHLIGMSEYRPIVMWW